MKVDKKKAARVALKVAAAVLVSIVARKAAKSPLVRDIAQAVVQQVAE